MTGSCTAFEDEDEVLVQDGLQYTIIGNDECKVALNDDCDPVDYKSYNLIQLKYPA